MTDRKDYRPIPSGPFVPVPTERPLDPLESKEPMAYITQRELLELLALRAENEPLREDAARLDWLSRHWMHLKGKDPAFPFEAYIHGEPGFSDVLRRHVDMYRDAESAHGEQHAARSSPPENPNG